MLMTYLIFYLFFVSPQARENGELNKSAGNLLYNLGTKLPRQFHNHLPFLVNYITNGGINQEAKLTAAIKFVQVCGHRDDFH